MSLSTEKVKGKNGLIGSQYWHDSSEKTFSQIASAYFIKPWWGKFSMIQAHGYSSQVLKPVNPYVLFFGEQPEVQIQGNKAKIIQKTYADIFFSLENRGMETEALYILDKVALRQFYPSNLSVEIPEGYFNHVFRLYTPWFIDRDIEARVLPATDIFHIHTKKIKFEKKDVSKDYIDCEFIHFSVKKTGRHIIEDGVGLIEKGTEIYSIEIEDEDVIKRLIKECGEKRV